MSTESDRIAALGELIAAQIPGLIEEARDQINESINAILEESQESEDGKAMLSLSLSVKWDLNGSAVVVSMPVAVKRRFERVAKLEDPDQPQLKGMEEA